MTFGDLQDIAEAHPAVKKAHLMMANVVSLEGKGKLKAMTYHVEVEMVWWARWIPWLGRRVMNDVAVALRAETPSKLKFNGVFKR